jgi:hypothetical protein
VTRRPSAALVVLLVVLATVATSCGLGAKQALADRIIAASKRLDAAGTATGTIDAEVALVKSDQPLVPGPPKILPGRITDVPSVFDLAHDSAAVGVKGDDPTTAVVVFRGSDLYQRIAPKTSAIAAAVLSSAASNLEPLVDAYHGITLALTAPADGAATTSSTTTTTIKHAALQRASRIPREWIAFDFASLDSADSTKRAGSLAINPVVLLGLVKGTLTGSIERSATGESGLTRYDGNVNRDKAERDLSDDEHKLLDKIFTANAVSGRTFPASIWLDGKGDIRRFRVRLRQHLTNVDRADLTITIDLRASDHRVRVGAPDSKATASVESLGQLVTAVARA